VHTVGRVVPNALWGTYRDQQVFINNFVIRVALLTGGLDMPFAKTAQGYSTTVLRLLYSHKILNLENMCLSIAQFVSDDTAIVWVNKIMIVMYECF
jgi:hypothetical protein